YDRGHYARFNRATYYGYRYINWRHTRYRRKMIFCVPSKNDRAARAPHEDGLGPATVRALAHVTRRVHEPDSSGSRFSFLKSVINKTHSSSLWSKANP